jgi:hypothetical protein
LDKRAVERWLGQPIETFSRPAEEPGNDGRDTVKAYVLELGAASYGTSAS